MANTRLSRFPYVAAGVLALAALAAFLILDLAGGKVETSSLPVIQIGQNVAAPSPGDGFGQSPSSIQTGTAPTTPADSTPTVTTVRETVNGTVYTGGTGSGGGGGTGTSGGTAAGGGTTNGGSTGTSGGTATGGSTATGGGTGTSGPGHPGTTGGGQGPRSGTTTGGG
jgi:hypothetical protein